MTPGDRRRWTVLRQIQLQDRLRQLEHESYELRQAIARTTRSSDRMYRTQIARELTARLNAILRERHTLGAQELQCQRELAS